MRPTKLCALVALLAVCAAVAAASPICDPVNGPKFQTESGEALSWPELKEKYESWEQIPSKVRGKMQILGKRLCGCVDVKKTVGTTLVSIEEHCIKPLTAKNGKADRDVETWCENLGGSGPNKKKNFLPCKIPMCCEAMLCDKHFPADKDTFKITVNECSKSRCMGSAFAAFSRPVSAADDAGEGPDAAGDHGGAAGSTVADEAAGTTPAGDDELAGDLGCDVAVPDGENGFKMCDKRGCDFSSTDKRCHERSNSHPVGAPLDKEAAEPQDCGALVAEEEEEGGLKEACEKIVDSVCAAVKSGGQRATFGYRGDCFEVGCGDSGHGDMVLIYRDVEAGEGKCKAVSQTPQCPAGADGVVPTKADCPIYQAMGSRGRSTKVVRKVWGAMICRAAENSVGEGKAHRNVCSTIKDHLRTGGPEVSSELMLALMELDEGRSHVGLGVTA